MSDRELFVSFNQDAGCFAVGSDQGFHIFNIEPFQKMFHRDFAMGGIGIVEMLYRSNILAVVGGGLNPRHPTNKVMIWDDHQSRAIGEISVNKDVILNVKLRRDLVVVVVERFVNLYNFRDLKLIDRIETYENRLGLIALSPSSTRQILAMPGTKAGQVRIENHLVNKSTSVFIQAHESELQCLALSAEGTMVATASIRGTLIRVFQTDAGQPLYELRRGAEQAVIHCISFNLTSTWLACSSDKGTCHVFQLGPAADAAQQLAAQKQQQQQQQQPDNLLLTAQISGLFSSLKDRVLPKYFNSEWSYAQFRLPATANNSVVSPNRKIMVAFGVEKNTIVVVSSDGRFFRASFDAGPGECVEKSRERFFYHGEDGDYLHHHHQE